MTAVIVLPLINGPSNRGQRTRLPHSLMVTSWFDWMLTYNTGAAFSFLADAGVAALVFDGIAAAVSVFIVVWLFRSTPPIAVWCCPSG